MPKTNPLNEPTDTPEFKLVLPKMSPFELIITIDNMISAKVMDLAKDTTKEKSHAV